MVRCDSILTRTETSCVSREKYMKTTRMTTVEAEGIARALGHDLAPWEMENKTALKQSVSLCRRRGCNAMAFILEEGPEIDYWYLGRALAEECEGY
jgi:hypothetical protein